MKNVIVSKYMFVWNKNKFNVDYLISELYYVFYVRIYEVESGYRFIGFDVDVDECMCVFESYILSKKKGGDYEVL